ncbi:butyrophilin-like protein 8 [Oreochromis niloticus]|uniref:butyrophilin-like protein 8 n=1 Tax=Oreochromis niloticus TaxID=8128 RepID=UPI0003943257|nr:butyrophilin-like protein 8 [Oreochromis niloticus]
MAVLITASHLWILSSVFLLEFTSADQKSITAESGQDVTLTCRAPKNNIDLVEWNRTDLEDKLVFVYRTGKPVPDEQHPAFKNRVDLQDTQMKDGDVSLILKNVTINDTGTYECRFPLESLDPISIITLSVVDPPGQTGGHTEDGGKEDGGAKSGSVGLIAGLVVPAVLLVGVAVFLIYINHDNENQD